VIYCGVNGLLDDIAVEKVVDFIAGLRDYLKTSKPKYIELVSTTKALGEEAEALLKEGIAEFTQSFLVSA
jgi:F-type H+-transporting ATPase subunit alpha